MTPIRLYSYQTPNGHKAAIMLEEIELPYEVTIVDIEKGDQKQPDYLALNPNGKIPVIVDPDRGRTIFESGAILVYLAERSGKLLPQTEEERDNAWSWILFQVGHVGPTMGQLWNFKVFAEEKLPTVIARFEREAVRLFGVLDGELGKREHIAGEAYGIADIALWPWVNVHPKLGLTLDGFPNLKRWFDSVGARPAVVRGLQVPRLSDHGES